MKTTKKCRTQKIKVEFDQYISKKNKRWLKIMKKMSNVEIKRGNTAIARQKMSRPMKKMYESGKFDKKTVLDYGCGKGFDVEYLKLQGIDIKGYEPFASDKYLQMPEGKFDIITNNYVLNVIENPAERKNLVEEMKKLGNTVVITVRADKKSIKSTWTPMNDGYLTPKNTFQKIYDEKSLKEEFGNVEILYKDAMGITFLA